MRATAEDCQFAKICIDLFRLLKQHVFTFSWFRCADHEELSSNIVILKISVNFEFSVEFKVLLFSLVLFVALFYTAEIFSTNVSLFSLGRS